MTNLTATGVLTSQALRSLFVKHGGSFIGLYFEHISCTGEALFRFLDDVQHSVLYGDAWHDIDTVPSMVFCIIKSENGAVYRARWNDDYKWFENTSGPVGRPADGKWIGWREIVTAPRESVTAPLWKELLELTQAGEGVGDLITHQGDLRKALEEMHKNAEPEEGGGDNTYWTHQLAVLAKMVIAADRVNKLVRVLQSYSEDDLERGCEAAWNVGGLNWSNDHTTGPYRDGWRQRIRAGIKAALGLKQE